MTPAARPRKPPVSVGIRGDTARGPRSPPLPGRRRRPAAPSVDSTPLAGARFRRMITLNDIAPVRVPIADGAIRTLSLVSVLLLGGVAAAQERPAPYDPYAQPDED